MGHASSCPLFFVGRSAPRGDFQRRSLRPRLRIVFVVARPMEAPGRRAAAAPRARLDAAAGGRAARAARATQRELRARPGAAAQRGRRAAAARPGRRAAAARRARADKEAEPVPAVSPELQGCRAAAVRRERGQRRCGGHGGQRRCGRNDGQRRCGRNDGQRRRGRDGGQRRRGRDGGQRRRGGNGGQRRRDRRQGRKRNRRHGRQRRHGRHQRRLRARRADLRSEQRRQCLQLERHEHSLSANVRERLQQRTLHRRLHARRDPLQPSGDVRRRRAVRQPRARPGRWRRPARAIATRATLKCALAAQDITTDTMLDGVVVVDGAFVVHAGATVTSPTGNLTIYATSIIVESGGVDRRRTDRDDPRRAGPVGHHHQRLRRPRSRGWLRKRRADTASELHGDRGSRSAAPRPTASSAPGARAAPLSWCRAARTARPVAAAASSG